MKNFLYATLMLGITIFAAGCEKSVQEEQQDVNEAKQDAAENVQEEAQDVDEAKRDAADNIAGEEKDVNEAAREGAADVTEEEQEAADKAIEEKRENEIKNDLDTPDPAAAPPATNP